jgi:2-alkenal reductase
MKKIVGWFHRRKPAFMLLAFVIPLIACSTSFSLGDFTSRQNTPTVERSVATQPVLTLAPTNTLPVRDLADTDNLLVALYQQAGPGVVSIQTLTDFGGAEGSGFVYDTEGHIITNYHVVEGATVLEIGFTSGMKVRGEVVGTDLDSDLAVIFVDVQPELLHPLPLGDSDLLQVGQSLVAIGNPFGLSGTMTLGILSAKGRTLDSLRQTDDGLYFAAGDLLQTDAAINPGNSGGPLLNLNGEVVGINRAIRTNGANVTGDPLNSGIGFAVSINIVKRVVPQLIETGEYDYPYLGVTALPELSLLEQEALGLPQSTGAYIVEVTPGGPADDAGLRAGNQSTELIGLPGGGDLITAVDGLPVQVFGDLLSYLMVYKTPGDQIVLTIIRDGETMEVPLTLDKRP